MDLQFYPTPPMLAKKAWAKFKDRDFSRVLEPSAGAGDLAVAIINDNDPYRRRLPQVDACEIDISKHPALQAKGIEVIGLDFLQMSDGSAFSHCLMNPPFAMGAQHVLHAWKILWDAEIVAIINAETVRNAFTQERQMLVDLILKNGTVEFIDGAFAVEEAERKTNVDIALVYLKKTASISEDIVGTIIDDLKKDNTSGKTLAGDFQGFNDLALPASEIENAVSAYNAAVKSMKDAVISEARAQYYARILGATMTARNTNDQPIRKDTSVNYVQTELAKRHGDLKDRAWASILRGSKVTSSLSSKAQKQVESQFEKIKKLEFNLTTIYGFLCGIVESKGKIQMDMCCDVFDEITKYHADNSVFYMGWKSNSKHRTQAMKIKMSRFVLPNHKDSWSSSIPYESTKLLSDFDKVFSMLDSKSQPDYGLNDAFAKQFDELKNGQRISTDYFDVRYFKGIGTIHFFPRRKDLIERLNRIVGRQRAWLPPEEDRVNDSFWLQYDQAEKFDAEIRKEIDTQNTGKSSWNHPLNNIFSSDEAKLIDAINSIDKAATKVLQHHGVNLDFVLENVQQDLLLLEAA